MKVTLIHSRFAEGNSICPPLGILGIGTLLKRHGHQVQLFDLDVFRSDPLPAIKEFGPDLIGISMMTTGYPQTMALLPRLKAQMPGCVYGMGGIHASSLPERTLAEFGLDFVCVGEGEYTLLDVCERLGSGTSLEGVKGILYRDSNGKVRDNGRRPLIENLDELPYADRTLLDFEFYLTPPGVLKGYFLPRSTSCMTSRGCPYRCIYCDSHEIFGRRYRRRSVEHVIGEIEWLIKDFGVTGFLFMDDIFTLNQEWVHRFCDTVLARNITFLWGCVTRVDTVSEGLLRKMKRAGCRHIEYGVESGSERILKTLKKGFTKEQIRKAFALTNRVGIRTFAAGMLNVPGQTMEDIEETKAFLEEIKPSFVHFFFTTPFPGTELWDMAIEKRWLRPDVDFSRDWDFRSTQYPAVPMGMDREELRRIRAALQNWTFFRNYVHVRNLRFAGSMASALLSSPLETLKVIGKVLRTKRVDDLVEFGLTQYRLQQEHRVRNQKR